MTTSPCVPVCVCTDCPPRLSRNLDAAFPEFLAHHQDLVYGVALRMTRATRRCRGPRPGHVHPGLPRIAGLRRASASAASSRAAGWHRSSPTWDATGCAADSRPRPGSTWHRKPQPSRGRSLTRSSHVAKPPGAGDHASMPCPDATARAVELRHVQGLSYPELAEALGRPLGTVKSDVHRGIHLLRASLISRSQRRRP